jgi:hypothetical protein
MNPTPHVNPYSDERIDALVAGTAGAGMPEIAGYPILKHLQKNNPEVDRYSRDSYVPGAQAGMYYLPAAERLLDKPVVQLIGLRPYWKEWQPNRGGPGDEHPKRPDEAVKSRNPTTGRDMWMMPNGNMVEQTVDLVMLLEGVKCGLPFKSTGLTALRNYFILPLKQKRIVLSDGRQVEPALFHVKAKLGSKPESNAFGEWVNPFPEEFFLYREPGGPSKKEIVDGFAQAKGYLQLAEDKLAALPTFATPPTPPEPPEPPALKVVQATPKPDIRSGRGAWTSPPPSPHRDDPGPTPSGGPPIDLEENDTPF